MLYSTQEDLLTPSLLIVTENVKIEKGSKNLEINYKYTSSFSLNY